MIGSTPFLWVVCATRQPWLTTRFRIRQWGRLPMRRGPTLLVTNHQHEDESEIIVERGFLQGPWRRTLFTASSRRMYEPGFFAGRMPWLAPLVRNVNFGPMFLALGMLPLENQLSSRPLVSLAREIAERHGDLPLREIFRDEALVPLGAGAGRVSDLQRPRYFERAQTMTKVALLRDPYRAESVAALRRSIDEEIAFIAKIVGEGTTFFVTPEGEYSTNGKMRPLRGIMTHLAPIADVWLCAVAFDPFRGRRTSMLYRILRPANPDDIATSLAAARPVTTTALLATFIQEHHRESFSAADALAGIVRLRAALPKRLFVDPELDAARERVVREALANLVRRGTLIEDGGRYRLGAVRTDPRFHGVQDVIAYHATFLGETIAAAQRLDEAR
ncbi:MAG TPA: hypothetical protein VMA36_13765 [Candidatus Limnocylindria bacterium]|jgi:hypothetical protein|nr:hypothetical protein [Candidatus Limnocylindria bacterium]